MITNRDSITHWKNIWEEEGHDIFINHENKYKYTFSSSWALNETLIWFCCFSSPRNSTSKLCNTRRKLLGKSWGEWESQFLQHKNAKIQVSSHGPLYLYLYLSEEIGSNRGQLQNSQFSSITSQTTPNLIFLIFLLFFTTTGGNHG